MIIDNCKRAALKRSANAMKRHIRLVMTTCLAMTACIVFTSSAKAQRNEVLSPDIASLQVTADDKWLQMPIMQLGSGSVMNIAFDDLTHEYHRYAYKLEHCEADWTVSDQLFASDYCKGFADGNTIDDMEESINTSVQYTHYRLQIPNDRCVPTISGNYRLTVYDDNTQDTVFKACFMIVEQQTAVALGVTTNTDIDINRSHQQVSMPRAAEAVRQEDHALAVSVFVEPRVQPQPVKARQVQILIRQTVVERASALDEIAALIHLFFEVLDHVGGEIAVPQDRHAEQPAADQPQRRAEENKDRRGDPDQYFFHVITQNVSYHKTG